MSDRYTLHTGDCRKVMSDYPADHFDSIVSDPPYGRSFLGNGWDKGVPGEEFWREALRVAKPGAHLLAFGGTRTFHRLTVAIEDSGWEIRDVVCWLYGSGFPKSLNVGGGWGTALKPAWEPVIMARKPLVGTVAANLLLHGTGALNVDGCRIPIEGAAGVWGAKHIASIGFHGGTAGSGFATVQHPQGRWPANVMHDGSDEVVVGFPNEQARFFYCAKASRADREEGCEQLPEVRRTDGRETEHHVPNLRTTALRNHHPTVKPTELMRYLIRLITPPGGTVLDPFMGSGSTGKAAMLEGATFRGCDLDPAYLAIAEARILFGLQLEAEEAAEAYESTRQLSLFGDP